MRVEREEPIHAAFLRALAWNGDLEGALIATGWTEGKARYRRTKHPEFARAWDLAVELGRAAAESGDVGTRPVGITPGERKRGVEPVVTEADDPRMLPAVLDDFLTELAKLGHIGKACEVAGTTRGTVWARRKIDGDFEERYQEAIRQGAELLEDEAWRRAVQGVPRPIYKAGVHVGDRLEFSDRLIELLLKRHFPERYIERRALELTGKDGGPVRTASLNLGALSVSKLNTLREILLEAAVKGDDGES